MYLDKQHPKPVYLQLKEMLQKQIKQGYYLAHQKLPSERDLCRQHDLSRMTARRALKALVAEGLAYTQAGKGTFAASRSTENHLTTTADEHKPVNAQQKFLRHQNALVQPFLKFDSVGAAQAIDEALAVSPIEAVASELFTDTIRYLEQQWLAGNVDLLAHNFAITTLRSHLISMMNATPNTPSGPKVVLGCAPGDQHEIGLLVLALGLQRRGFLVVYFGATLSTETLDELIETAKPQIICLSAATDEAVANLSTLGKQCVAQQLVKTERDNGFKEKPLLTFGGVAFTQNRNMADYVPGLYLGDSIKNAIAEIKNLVSA